MKQELLEKLSIFLLKKGFTIKNLTRTCFDALARRNEQILLIKVLEDANSVSRQYTEEMAAIASYANASPLIIAEKAGNRLEDNIVYSRFGIYTLNFSTFLNCVNNKFPFVRRSQAGLTASVVGKKLKEKREGLGYSLNALSKKLGVTSRMVIKYENENSEVTINKAMKMYELFGGEIFSEVDIFMQNKQPESKFETEVSRKYVELGFNAAETKKTPFDIIARKEKELVFTEIGDNVNPQMQSLSKLLDADNLVIFQKKKPKNIPSLTQDEFMDFEKANELVKFLREF
ncbi:helix-turn-helix domain-containing protein [Candidatus Woesearchaeota archaeon]|nr:helix-turn-helix domain-containing protein [Candidatus Woesearchaeota archaeon]